MTAQPCNDFASLHANPYSDSTKVVASLRSNGEHGLAILPLSAGKIMDKSAGSR
jgi:hypothetical protein